MPGDIRSEEFGPYPYYYEDRYTDSPERDTKVIGRIEQWREDKGNEQLRRVFVKIRDNYINPDNI